MDAQEIKRLYLTFQNLKSGKSREDAAQFRDTLKEKGLWKSVKAHHKNTKMPTFIGDRMAPEIDNNDRQAIKNTSNARDGMNMLSRMNPDYRYFEKDGKIWSQKIGSKYAYGMDIPFGSVAPGADTYDDIVAEANKAWDDPLGYAKEVGRDMMDVTGDIAQVVAEGIGVAGGWAAGRAVAPFMGQAGSASVVAGGQAGQMIGSGLAQGARDLTRAGYNVGREHKLGPEAMFDIPRLKEEMLFGATIPAMGNNISSSKMGKLLAKHEFDVAGLSPKQAEQWIKDKYLFGREAVNTGMRKINKAISGLEENTLRRMYQYAPEIIDMRKSKQGQNLLTENLDALQRFAAGKARGVGAKAEELTQEEIARTGFVDLSPVGKAFEDKAQQYREGVKTKGMRSIAKSLDDFKKSDIDVSKQAHVVDPTSFDGMSIQEVEVPIDPSVLSAKEALDIRRNLDKGVKNWSETPASADIEAMIKSERNRINEILIDKNPAIRGSFDHQQNVIKSSEALRKLGMLRKDAERRNFAYLPRRKESDDILSKDFDLYDQREVTDAYGIPKYRQQEAGGFGGVHRVDELDDAFKRKISDSEGQAALTREARNMDVLAQEKGLSPDLESGYTSIEDMLEKTMALQEGVRGAGGKYGGPEGDRGLFRAGKALLGGGIGWGAASAAGLPGFTPAALLAAMGASTVPFTSKTLLPYSMKAKQSLRPAFGPLVTPAKMSGYHMLEDNQ